MISSLRQILKALAFLRRPEALQALSESAAGCRLREEVARAFPGLVLESGVALLGYAPERLQAASARVARGSLLSFGDEVTGYSTIAIGEGSWIGQFNNLRASNEAPIRIGRRCLISQFCTLVAANHQVGRDQAIMDQPLDPDRRGVVLEDDVWLGAGCVVLPGVTVAQGSVIGANSVVTRDTAPYEIWAGVPARKIGERGELADS